ncbi:MAG: MGMT family protein [Gemmatimonadetes bacterium]|nr:MGMT family protein [Gemmatimonadota bacterium]
MSARKRRSISYARIYSIIRRIPRGRVATYGQVARLAGIPGHARQVGYALHALTDGSPVPWHRVVNARGGVSRRATPGAELEQRLRLEAEGVRFDARAQVPLARFQWKTGRRGLRRARPLR